MPGTPTPRRGHFLTGRDPAKYMFRVQQAAADGSVLLPKTLSRPQHDRFMADRPPCLVAMDAVASADRWARDMSCYGHEVRLIAPHSVKPLLKRQKSNAADAEVIVEAALAAMLLPKAARRLKGPGQGWMPAAGWGTAVPA